MTDRPGPEQDTTLRRRAALARRLARGIPGDPMATRLEEIADALERDADRAAQDGASEADHGG